MRTARALRMLLLLQNRGRLTTAQLAQELEVTPRTILRDVDALTEAGLPIIVFQGNQGGIELGFEYRTRLTGLDRDEARAMAVILSQLPMALTPLGLKAAGRLAAAKLWEAFPDQTRQVMEDTRTQFPMQPGLGDDDPRLPALAKAVRGRQIVYTQARTPQRAQMHPLQLGFDGSDWFVSCGLRGAVMRAAWGDINISAKRFEGSDPKMGQHS